MPTSAWVFCSKAVTQEARYRLRKQMQLVQTISDSHHLETVSFNLLQG
jgi:hypothetical protein